MQCCYTSAVASSAPVRVAVAGCTGYIGMQCVALAADHPNLELTRLIGRSWAGRPYRAAVPGSGVDLMVEEDLAVHDVDVVLAALPHGVSAACARDWLSAGALVVDMSADFRLRDAAEHRRWYGDEHVARDLCARSVYGLVEFARADLAHADLIAAPGCYATAGLLGTLPGLAAGLAEPAVVVDAKSGVSGAGRSPSPTVHLAEAAEAVRAYAVAGHRHSAEMLQAMQRVESQASLVLVPHLVPMVRGILATCYLRPRAGAAASDLVDAYRDLCAVEPFLRWDDLPPSTKSVLHGNVAAINATVQGDWVVVTVAIDNLIKGAAGQGIQALNVRLGLAETAGLPRVSPWP